MSSNDIKDLDQFWNLGDPLAIETTFQKLVIEQKSRQDEDLSFTIELLTQVARAQGLQGRIVDAETTLAEAEKLVGKHPDTSSVRARIRCMLERGRFFCLAKTPARARPLFWEVWDLATHSGEDFLAIDAAQMVAATEPRKQQVDWILRGLGLAESSSQPTAKRWLGALYSTLGWHYYELRQFERALDLFRKARGVFEAELTTSGPDAAAVKKVRIAKWSIAKTLRAQGHVQEALQIQKELLAEVRQGGNNAGDICEELAECLTMLKKAGEAEAYFETAYREFSQDEWIVDNMPEKLKRLKAFGKVK